MRPPLDYSDAADFRSAPQAGALVTLIEAPGCSMGEDGRRSDLLQRGGVGVGQSIVIAQPNWTLPEDRGVEDTCRQVGSFDRGMAAIVLPEGRIRLLPSKQLPRRSDRSNLNTLFLSNRQVAIADRGLHRTVADETVLRPAVAMAPGHKEHGMRPGMPHLLDQRSRRGIHL